MDPDLDQVKTPSSLSMPPPTLIRTNSAVFNGLLLATAASVKPAASVPKLQDGLDLSQVTDYVFNKHQKQEDMTMKLEDEEDLEPPPIHLHLGYLVYER